MQTGFTIWREENYGHKKIDLAVGWLYRFGTWRCGCGSAAVTVLSVFDWFIGTKLYKDNLESYVQGKGMTPAAKRRVMTTVTLLMGFGFVMMLMKALYVPCIILGCVWVFHIVYFLFGVKTLEEAEG